MIKPVKRQILSQTVIAQIVELIRDKKWISGEKIPSELELATQFALSRNSMREALKSLVHSGILESKPGSGTFVSRSALRNIRSMDLGELLNEELFIVELIESRLIIEPQLAYIAAARATTQEINELELSVQNSLNAFMDKAYSDDMGFDFHRKIVQVSKNRFMLAYLESIEEEMKYQRSLLGKRRATAEDLQRELYEHAAICAFIKANNPEDARQSMAFHLENAMKIMRGNQRDTGIR